MYRYEGSEHELLKSMSDLTEKTKETVSRDIQRTTEGEQQTTSTTQVQRERYGRTGVVSKGVRGLTIGC